MNLIEIILFAIIGHTINAGTGYWIVYGVGIFLHCIGLVIKASED